MRIRELFEDDNGTDKHITFCFGRMNPPTIGHKVVFDTMKSQGGDMKIFVSQSQDRKRNPLDYSQKIDFIRKLHPQYSGEVVDNNSLNTAWKVAAYLYSEGYRHATFVGGDERKKMFDSLKKYNGQEGPHGFYDFETFDFESTGERDEESTGIEGISATKARQFAIDGDLEAFTNATGAGEHAEDLFNAVRKGLNIKDEQ